MKLSALATEIGGTLIGDPDFTIIGVKALADAKEGDLTFFLDKKFKTSAEQSPASACISIAELKNIPNQILITNAKDALAKTLRFYAPHFESFTPDYISSPTFEHVHMGPNCLIGSHTKIGPNTRLFGNITIGIHCQIGEGCTLHPNVVLYNNTIIGNNVTIHAGTVIGADGFGYFQQKGIHEKVPQIGRVIIGDNVEIGANSSIDRGCIGDTVIGKGTKIDNLVQIGHNASIGDHCILVSQTGISGSAKLGHHVICGGQSAISAITVGNCTMIAAKSGVTKNVSENTVISGFPAWDHKKETKKEAWLRQKSQGRNTNETV